MRAEMSRRTPHSQVLSLGLLWRLCRVSLTPNDKYCLKVANQLTAAPSNLIVGNLDLLSSSTVGRNPHRSREDFDRGSVSVNKEVIKTYVVCLPTQDVLQCVIFPSLQC